MSNWKRHRTQSNRPTHTTEKNGTKIATLSNTVNNLIKPNINYYLSATINTIKEAPVIPSVSPIITSNGFIINYLGKSYAVTTAHTFFAEAQTPIVDGDDTSGQMQNVIVVEVNGNLYHISSDKVIYSRSLDVGFIPLPTLNASSSVPKIDKNFKTGTLGELCYVNYNDVLSRTKQVLSGKYVPFIQGQVDMFAITEKASNGTSGSPVFDNNGKYLGMVSAISGSDSEYVNMTICVPSSTLTSLLNLHNKYNTNNLDECNIFSGIFTNSILPEISMYIDSSNNYLSKQIQSGKGQRVIYADASSNMYPWDIITHATANNKSYTIGGNANEYSLNRVLLENASLNTNTFNLNLTTYRVDDYYFKRFHRVSQTIYTKRQSSNDKTHNIYKPLSEVVFDITVTNSNVVTFPDISDNTVFDDSSPDSLFYIGQQVQYSTNTQDFNQYNRNYATIVDISQNAKSITLNKTLNGDIRIAILPLGIGGWVQYNSPTKYKSNSGGWYDICWSAWGDGENADGDGEIVGQHIGDGEFNEAGVEYSEPLYRFKIDASYTHINNNIFVIQSYTNLLFLMIASMDSSIQEKIQTMITEINRLYSKIRDLYPAQDDFLDFIGENRADLYWVFFSNCMTRFGQDTITMFNVIPDPPYDPSGNNFGVYENWDDYKSHLFADGDIYNTPISYYATNMMDGSGNVSANSFNNSLFNTTNGWFYGTVSDRAGEAGRGLRAGANIASQQLEMILENLLQDGSSGYITNLVSIQYLMELCGVSWNNLLIAHNWRKANGLSSKLIFNKV